MDAGQKDEELIDSIGRGDERALVLLMERHKEAVFRFVFRYLNNEADSEEVTEETFLRVYRKAGGFRAKARVKTWIFSIAVNLCRDRLRKEKKRRGHVSLHRENDLGDEGRPLEERLDSGTATPSRMVDSEEKVHFLEECIAKLPEKLRFPFVYCVLEDHSYDDCAAVLGTNRKTIETRIYRGRKRLREQLSPVSQKG